MTLRDTVEKLVAAADYSGLHNLVRDLSHADDETAAALVAGLESEEWRVRMRCLEGLAAAEPNLPRMAAVARFLDDSQASVARAAALTLASYGASARDYAAAVSAQAVRYLEAGDHRNAKFSIDAVACLGADAKMQERLFQLAEAAFVGEFSYGENVLLALAAVAEDKGRLRELLERGLWTEFVQPCAESLATIIEEPVDLAETLLPAVDAFAMSPDSPLWGKLGAAPGVVPNVVSALVLGRFEAWHEWDAIVRWAAMCGSLFTKMTPHSMDAAEFAEWLLPMLPEGEYDRAEFAAKAFSGSAEKENGEEDEDSDEDEDSGEE